ncbi:MAG: SDR family oxidoreductase [Pseudomonadota bacterium]
MELKDKGIVVTGAASGIGTALVKRFAEEAPKYIVCADLNEAGAQTVAEQLKASHEGLMVTHAAVNVGNETEIKGLIEDTEDSLGPIDLFCSNAGILLGGGLDTPNEDWARIWDVNVMAHIWAARHLVPRMSERGGGYLLNTSSAAGLLNQIGSAPYGVTKHAAVAVGEWISMTHGDEGIKVSVLCPQAVRSEMTRGFEDHVAAIDGMLEPEPVAEACIETIRDETFLVLPHKQVADYIKFKAGDYDKWLGGMRKLNRQYAHLGRKE